jgi:DNA invertase Pin-like site-specific DNA recombinase
MSGQAKLTLANASGGPAPVAAYVRISTEQQLGSIDDQLDRIKDHAASRAMEIIRVFADPGTPAS